MSRIDNNRPSSITNPSDVESTDEVRHAAQPPDNQQTIDRWERQPDAHGCPACPHPPVGLKSPEPPTVLLNSQPAKTMKDLKE